MTVKFIDRLRLVHEIDLYNHHHIICCRRSFMLTTAFEVPPAVVCVDELRRMTRLAFEHECTHCGGSAARFDMAHMTMMVCCRQRCAGKSTADGCAIVDSVLSVSCRSLCRRNTADD